MALKLTENALTVLERRYLKKVDGKVVETPEQMFRRVAANIAAVEADVYGKPEDEVKRIEEEFYKIMSDLEFIPNSPTLMNAGLELQQLSACYVLPVPDSMEGIFDAIKYAALIHKSGGGTGFSFSRIRPKNDRVLSTGGVASGPISFMKVFNTATNAVKQGGTRRGANMAILRVDHPDILEFIDAKRNDEELTNFNISVGLTAEFMNALERGENYKLVNPRNGEVVGELNAKEVMDKIVEGAWKNGEPGIVFLDRINEANPTPKLGVIESTNPCGEQPLLPYESCNLGSINLSKLVKGSGKKAKVDYDRLGQLVDIAVRFLDNVIDANRFPLDLIEEMTKKTRKIGLGVMGFAEMLILLGIPYDSEEALRTGESVMKFINERAMQASEKLAEERGSFPAFGDSIYAGKRKSLRNATLTTIAPTGTISIIAGTSSGIEPLFAICYQRNVLDNDKLIEVNPVFEKVAKERGFYSPELMAEIAEKGSIQDIESIPDDVRRVFVTALDVDPVWHVMMQAVFQRHTHNAVSKTCNLRNEATKEDVYNIYMLAYREGCKGITVYRDGSRESQVLTTGKSGGKENGGSQGENGGETASKAEGAQMGVGYAAPGGCEECAIGRAMMEPRERPDVTRGTTEKVRTGCGNVYVTVNEDELGLCEVFTQIGKAGGCASAQAEAISRLISLALRSGVKVQAIIHQLRGIRCPAPAWNKGEVVLSCPDAIGRVLEHSVLKDVREDLSASSMEETTPQMGACPECGGHLKHEDGCSVCMFCGFSKCG